MHTDFEKKPLQISPNHFTSKVNIEFEAENSSLAKVLIYNIDGSLVQKYENYQTNGVHSTEINLEKLSSGTYILKVFDGR